MPSFTPPTTDDTPPIYGGQDPHRPVPALSQKLFRHYKPRARGRTVLKNGGVYRTVDYPTDTEVAAADVAYLGGHVAEVDAGEAAALQAAGYTVQP